jgi:hypothetical protein
MADTLLAQVEAGDAAQFLVNEGNQFGLGFVVASLQLAK